MSTEGKNGLADAVAGIIEDALQAERMFIQNFEALEKVMHAPEARDTTCRLSLEDANTRCEMELVYVGSLEDMEPAYIRMSIMEKKIPAKVGLSTLTIYPKYAELKVKGEDKDAFEPAVGYFIDLWVTEASKIVIARLSLQVGVKNEFLDRKATFAQLRDSSDLLE